LLAAQTVTPHLAAATQGLSFKVTNQAINATAMRTVSSSSHRPHAVIGTDWQRQNPVAIIIIVIIIIYYVTL